jgi:phospholipase C
MAGPEHIIVLMLENNSFDRVFGALFPHRPHATSPGGGTKGTTSNFTNTDATTGTT